MSDEQKETKGTVEPQKELSIEEMIEARTKQLAAIDSSIITTQRLIQGGNIKVIEGKETEDPLTLTISGGEMVHSMLTPTLNKLLKDRGSVSFDLDRLEAMKAQQVQVKKEKK